jgi:hypothetical protein
MARFCKLHGPEKTGSPRHRRACTPLGYGGARTHPLQRLLWALADLKEQVLSQAPKLFATMAEAPLEDLDRLRQEVESFLDQLKPVA